MHKPLKMQGRVPRMLTADKLNNHGAAKREIMRGVMRRQRKGLSNQVKNTHLFTRICERIMGHLLSE